MAALAQRLDFHLDRFEKLEAARGGREPEWLRELRRTGLQRFIELDFPTTRDEEWKYTNLAALAKKEFAVAGPGDVDAALVEQASFGDFEAARLVFVNGRFSAEQSTATGLSGGATAGSIAQLLAGDPAVLEGRLGAYADAGQQALVALNSAFFEDGAFVSIPDRAVAEKPIHLIFVSTETNAVSHPRVLIVGGADCEASVIETYVSAGAESYWTNTVTEIFAAENARIGHYKIQKEHPSAFHTGYVHMVQQRTSVVHNHSLAFGGGLVRNDIRAVLADQGADCNLNGLYTIGGSQHVDNHTVIDHARPHCTSHELYKGVLDGRSTGVFSGKIIVRKDAQKTDAIQSNKNLLLSDQANINTKPQLEIEADDVRCTHGATVGQMDEEALFYLQSRAIGIKEARALLTYAFAADILDRVRFEPVRERLEAELFEWLGREQKAEQSS